MLFLKSVPIAPFSREHWVQGHDLVVRQVTPLASRVFPTFSHGAGNKRNVTTNGFLRTYSSHSPCVPNLLTWRGQQEKCNHKWFLENTACTSMMHSPCMMHT